MILDGTDAGLHGTVNTATTPVTLNSTWVYLRKGYDALLAGVPVGYTNNGKVAVVGATTSTATGNDCGAAAYYIGQVTGVTVEFINGASNIETFFAGVLSGTNRYKMIHIVEEDWCDNGMDGSEAAKVNAAGQAIAAHVNRGGALFAQSQSYGWLSSLFPDVTRTDDNGFSPQLTTNGIAQFPGLTNSDITAPWHNGFSSTGTFPLTVLADEASGTKKVIVGGASVSLPSAVINTPTPSSSGNRGTQVCFVVNVKSGNPLANFQGATVNFTISGPNSSATIASQVTDASGNTPSVCYTGASAGVDTITAVAINPSNSNSLGESVISFTWTVAPTTAAPTTVAAALPVTGSGKTGSSPQLALMFFAVGAIVLYSIRRRPLRS